MNAGQLALGFPVLERDPAQTLIAVSCQAAARAALAQWRDWPGGTLLLVGDAGAGKSHLAAVWAQDTSARAIDLASEALALISGGYVVAQTLIVEDVDRWIEERAQHVEAALIALLDAVKAERTGPLLLTARARSPEWPVTTPDLASRLAVPPVVEIEAATDEDLAAVFEKQLADRRATPGPGLTEYVLRRAHRSFGALERLAGGLDTLALERKQRISRNLARELLGEHEGGEEADHD